MFNDKRVVIFVANDALRYVVEKVIEERIADAIITINEEKARKSGASNYLDIGKMISSQTLKVYYAKKYSLKDKRDEMFIMQVEPDIGFVLGWNRLIPERIIEAFKIGIFGFHGTPFGLPRGRGRSPTIWTMVLGFNKFYLHMFKLTAGVDEGPIYDTEEILIHRADSIKTFHMKISYFAWLMLRRSLPKIASGYTGQRQKGKPVYFRKRTEKDGKIKWILPAERIYNLVRGVTRPYPGAYTVFNGEKIRIWWAVPFDVSNNVFGNVSPGTVCVSYGMEGFVVKAGVGAVLVTDWEPRVLMKEGDKLD